MEASTHSKPRRPARLRAGARVALVAPAGPAPAERVDRAVEQCLEAGLTPVPADGVRSRAAYLAGDDAMRARDLQRAIDDPAIDAIWAVRGGYGTMRILERIDWTLLRERPRPFIGFSDNTAIHMALARHGLVSFHGPHAGATRPPFTRACFEAILFDAFSGRLPLPPGTALETRCGGSAEGTLTGGNLTLLAALCGTPFQMRAHDCIVLIEDVGEPAYRVDRALT
ncbi:MAG: LD-carboxypeptidase, partial [Gemmatimonadetes bacterium]|nr:LD-carboxypeptidase [Gemmatimonadota bacterium]